MVNASVYAYENLEEYMKLYPKGQDVITENHLSALYINNKSVVFVSDTRDKASGYRPDFSKSMVYFDNGEKAFEKYIDQFEHVTDVKVKDNMIVFSGLEVDHIFAIARKVGDIKNDNVRGYILFDDSKPRVNVIMNPVN
jgi:ethanolamine utilization cobalamin adenosyltransferase